MAGEIIQGGQHEIAIVTNHGIGEIIQPIDMSLRTAEHEQGIQDALDLLSAKCGFGEQHYKFQQGNVTTATQIVSENSTLFRTVKKHEIVLEEVLVNLCRILLRMGNAYMRAGLNEDVEISIDFDDSIIEDRQTDEARVYMMLNAGLMKPEEARSILMNEDIETLDVSQNPELRQLIAYSTEIDELDLQNNTKLVTC